MPYKDQEISKSKQKAYALKSYYRRKERKDENTCSNCSGLRDDPRFKKCTKCRVYLQEYKRMRRKNPDYVPDKRHLCKGRPPISKELGECLKPTCHNQAEPPFKYCRKCRGRWRQWYGPHIVAAQIQRNREIKSEVFTAYGGCCACCGETTPEFLSIDHIEGHNGSTPRSGVGLYRWLRRHGYPLGFRVLCMNCNFSLGHVGSCSHSDLTQVTNLGRPRTRGAEPRDTSEWRRTLKLAAFNAYGGSVCNCCGDADVHRLCLDHIDGRGADHRRKIGKGGLYSWLRNNNYPVGFRVLCINCNFSLGAYGYCPHGGRMEQQVVYLQQ